MKDEGLGPHRLVVDDFLLRHEALLESGHHLLVVLVVLEALLVCLRRVKAKGSLFC